MRRARLVSRGVLAGAVRGCGGAGPVGALAMMALLSAFGVGAALLAPRDVAPAFTGEVEQIICKVGALILGGACPDDDPFSSPEQMAVHETSTRIFPKTGEDAAKFTVPKCMGVVRDPYLTTPVVGKDANKKDIVGKVVVAEAWIQCDRSVDSLVVKTDLYRILNSNLRRVGGSRRSIRTNESYAEARFEYPCWEGTPKEYVVYAMFDVEFAPGVGGGNWQETVAVTLDC